MNRRDTLKALGFASAAGGALMLDSCGPKTAKKEAVAVGEKLPGVTDVEHERNTQLAEAQFFSPHELTTIGVLADIIIPADDVSGSARSEARRVGKECVSQCRSRWAPYNQKNKT